MTTFHRRPSRYYPSQRPPAASPPPPLLPPPPPAIFEAFFPPRRCRCRRRSPSNAPACSCCYCLLRQTLPLRTLMILLRSSLSGLVETAGFFFLLPQAARAFSGPAAGAGRPCGCSRVSR
ncbi:unnamed protein product [Ectocarpus sp. 8 AP-2014]